MALVLSTGISAQSPKPQPPAAVLKGQQPAFTLAQRSYEFRGGGGDECLNANQLTVGTSCAPVTFDATSATESQAPVQCGAFTSPDANDLWFSFVATSPFTDLTVTGLGDFDAVIQYYSGPCGNLVAQGCIDNTFPPNSTIETGTLATTPGQTYYFRVYYYSEPLPTNFQFTVCLVGATSSDYCTAGATNVATNFEKIANVTFADINNNSTSFAGYEDFTAVTGNVTTGTSYPFSLTTVNPWQDDQVLVWIDANQDSDFDDAGELVFTSTVGEGPYVGNITIPVNATLGQTRMRVRMHDSAAGPNATPCGTSTYGQVEDYTLDITDSGIEPPPNDECTGAVPQDLNVGSTVTFSGDNTGATVLAGTNFVVVWEAFTLSTCATVTVNYCVPGSVFEDFLVNLAVQCPDVLTGIQTGTVANNCTVTFTELQAGTYYIPVLVDPASTPVGAYTIAASAVACPAGYCSASATNVTATFEKISNVAFVNINNPSTLPDGYEDFTAIVGNVDRGTTNNITVTLANGYATDEVRVWVDLDQSETFEANELVYTSALGVGPHTGPISIPANATLGQTRMRIRLHDTDLGPNANPCGTSTYGQVEDYTLNITDSGIEPPPNDECTGAVAQNLNVGSTVTYTGDNTGATVLVGTNFVVVWEAFTLSTCATVTVNYCVPGSVFEDFLVNLAVQCPDVLNGILGGTVANNCTVTFTELQAGTYYIPVLVDPLLTPVGPYTIAVSAVACPEGYCSASATNVTATFEKIANVTYSDINNPSSSAVGYEDFTGVVGNVARGSNQPITVTLSNGYATDQVLVWIDLDQSESFEPNELLYTSTLGVGPHTGTISIPQNATLGATRMRVRLHDTDLGPNAAACGTSTYGQVEDYTITIDLTTGVDQAAEVEMGVFPNPTNGDFSIRYGADGRVDLELLDMTGRLVHTEQLIVVSGELSQVSLAGRLAPGTYLLRLNSDLGRSEQRIVIH
jgi:hypothetical protein